MESTAPVEFAGNARFQVTGTLGRGASGTVYRALDRARNAEVALKTLNGLDAELRYRFKREFRALSNVHDEHLVELFELVADSDPWFFTMELIHGSDFIRHLRGSRSIPSPASVPPAEAVTLPPPPPPDLARVRSAFAQLCRGLHALHSAGLLHRDVKPSNVLVTHDGRVVLVDFGIVAELAQTGQRSRDLTALVGTPAYMAPEQCTGDPVTSASDWYAVGVMLFEALTGHVPFENEHLGFLAAKLELTPPSARSLVSGLPEDLELLCARLLAPAPAERPQFAEIMQCFATRDEGASSATIEISDEPVFVGREEELTRLATVLDDVRPGAPVVLHVPGTSGMGKSSLVEHFLAQADGERGALVLTSRCCERESMPFRALDGAIDALAFELASLDAAELPELAPGAASALVRIFPVLAQVSFRDRHGAPVQAQDAEQAALRARAVSALRALLRKLASERPVILAIDDAQWGDEDSAALLGEILSPPEPPGILLLLAYRREWAQRAPLLMPRSLGFGAELPVHSVPVDPLPEARARALAARWLKCDEADASVSEVVAESQGSPLLLMEFARHVQAVGIPETGLKIAEVLRERFDQLSEGPRKLLEAISVAARPLEPSLAVQAARMTREEGAAAVRALRQAHLVRTHDVRGKEPHLETFHDRVRETIVTLMGDDSVQHQHELFVAALDALRSEDVDALYQHCRGARQGERAAHYAVLAAEEARRGFAFVRAAELFAAALELAPQHANAGELRVKRADALASAGRRKDAAKSYLEAAHATTSEATVWLECAAVEQFLGGGDHDLGMHIAEGTLRRVGVPLARSRTTALLSLAARVGWMQLTGPAFKERPEEELPHAQLAQIDAGYRVARGVTIADPLRGGDLFLRSAQLAMRAGEIKRVSIGLSYLAAVLSTEGPSARARRLLDLSHELATRSGDAAVIRTSDLTRGMMHALLGEFRVGLVGLERAVRQFPEGSRDFECIGTHSIIMLVLYFLGQVREICTRVPQAVAEAIQCGDAYCRGLLTTSKANMCWLALDQPETHAELIRTGVMSQARGSALSIDHISALVTSVDNDLYVGEPDRAARRLKETVPLARASMLLRMLITAAQVHDAQARVSLTLALLGKDAEKQRKMVLACARDLDRLKQPWPRANAILLRAGEADVAGHDERAVELYRTAAQAFAEQGMELCATVARFRLGQWLGGDEGGNLTQSADRWLRDQHVRNPSRMLRMMVPSQKDPRD